MNTFKNKFSLRSKGQAMLESVIVFVILLALIFGAMDFARLSWTLFHYQGISQAAVRGEVVGKPGWQSANILSLALFHASGLCYVKTTRDSSINSKAKKHNFLIKLGPLLPVDKTRLETVKSKVFFRYKPLFSYGKAWGNVGKVPLSVDYSMPREAPVGDPW